MTKRKVLLAVIATGVTAGAALTTLTAATSSEAGGAQPYGGVRVVRP